MGIDVVVIGWCLGSSSVGTLSGMVGKVSTGLGLQLRAHRVVGELVSLVVVDAVSDLVLAGEGGIEHEDFSLLGRVLQRV